MTAQAIDTTVTDTTPSLSDYIRWHYADCGSDDGVENCPLCVTPTTQDYDQEPALDVFTN